MTASIEVPKANPNLTATGGFQFLNKPMLSQYLESEYSIFGNAADTPIGTAPTTSGMATPGISMSMPAMGMGYGMGFGLYGSPEYIDRMVEGRKKLIEGQYDIADYSSDRETKFAFKQRGNAYTLNTNSSVLKNLIGRMSRSIGDNNMREACAAFERIYETIQKDVGIELMTHEERVNAKESIKAAIADYYEQLNGTSLVDDIEKNGSSEWSAAWDRAMGEGQPSRKEAISYMTNDKKQYSFWENIFRKWFRSNDNKAHIEETTDY